MDKNAIIKMLENHKLWLNGSTTGIQASAEKADLRNADLRGANLKGANLKGANLEGANLIGANLEDAYLKGADLMNASLMYADLKDANLEGAYLRGANLRGANLRGANLKGATLKGANLENTGVYIFSTGPHFGFLHENTIKIGCISHDVDYWRKNIVKIGRENKYTNMQIKQVISILKLLLKIQRENKNKAANG